MGTHRFFIGNIVWNKHQWQQVYIESRSGMSYAKDKAAHGIALISISTKKELMMINMYLVTFRSQWVTQDS